MDESEYRKLKIITAKMYSLCNHLWPDEFRKKYRAAPYEFRDWLNQKTGLSVDHIEDRITAVEAWVNAMDHIVR